jgi:hypothetical protein
MRQSAVDVYTFVIWEILIANNKVFRSPGISASEKQSW